MVFLLSLAALAGPMPSIDTPLKTGAVAPGDAAVVIGLEDYAFIQDVPYAKRDAQAMYDWLVYSRGVPADRVRLLNQGAGKEQITEAITAAGTQVKAGGTVWVYYAGHGAADPSTGERLLLGDDVRQDPAAFASRGVKVSDITKLAQKGGGNVSLLVDACYSGKGRSGEDLVAGKRFAVPAYATGAVPASVLEWNAAAPDQLSGPLEGAQHGAFTYFAIGALRGWADGEIDGTRDGKVTAEEAKLYVTSALKSVQITTQTPQMSVTEGAKRVLVTSAALETAPKFDASSGTSTTPPATTAASGPIDPSNRAALQAKLQGLYDKCREKHGAGDPAVDQMSIRFKVMPGPILKGMMIVWPQQAQTTTANNNVYATHLCVREDILALPMSSPSAPVIYKDVFAPSPGSTPSVKPVATPAASAPAPTTPAPTPTPATVVASPTTTIAIPGATITMPGYTTGMPGMTVEMPMGPAYPLPATGPATAPASVALAAPKSVNLVFRSLDGEWFDVRIDGAVVAEMRNAKEVTATVTPGVHTIEVLPFMSEVPFVTGRFDSGLADHATFGVDVGAPLVAYDHDGWSPR